MNKKLIFTGLFCLLIPCLAMGQERQDEAFDWENPAVIGINNSRYAEICNPPLTSLDNMLYDLSLTAARNMIALLQGGHINKKMMICSEVVERKTT